MDFYQGGLYSQYRDEGCFVKYMADAIQSAQLHLKNEQWDINVDFEMQLRRLDGISHIFDETSLIPILRI